MVSLSDSLVSSAARPLRLRVRPDLSVRRHRYHGQPWEDFPNVKRWFDVIAKRDAVQEGMKLLTDKRAKTRDVLDDKSRDVLFGKTQLQRR